MELMDLCQHKSSIMKWLSINVWVSHIELQQYAHTTYCVLHFKVLQYIGLLQ